MGIEFEFESNGNLLFPKITMLIPDNLILIYKRENKNETESWNYIRKLLDYFESIN